jgi:CubicO group peptidase (beta-lactamase class C family)
MRNIAAILMILIDILVFNFNNNAQTIAGKWHSKKLSPDQATIISRLENEIPKLMEKALIPGMSIAVLQDGKLVWNRGFGVKNANTGEPVSEETIFESASLGKPVFAYAVMKLVQREKIDLDVPLIEYAPISYLEKIWDEYNTSDQRFKRITARMCLSHTTGFPNWLKNRLYLESDPGEKWGYSGSGYVLLGTVVEKITGMTLDKFIDREVLRPLRMKDSWFCWLEQFKKQSVHWHNNIGRPVSKHKYLEPLAAGSLYTTSRDYARFLMAIINETDLDGIFINEMLKKQVKVTRQGKEVVDIFWGLGFGLHETNQHKSFWHHGDNENLKTYFEVFKNKKEGVKYFANAYNGFSITDAILNIAFKQKLYALRKFTNYADHNSPEIRFYYIYNHGGTDATINFLNSTTIDTAEIRSITDNMILNVAADAGIYDDLNSALRIARAGISSYPQSPLIYSFLGEIYWAKRDIEKAVSSYKKALEIDPGLQSAIEGLERLNKENKK